LTTLLHLDASARRRSISREVSAAFADAWRAQHPDGGHMYRDLARDPVPFIDEAWTELCDTVLAQTNTDLDQIAQLVRTPAQASAWNIVAPLLAELRAAVAPTLTGPLRPRSTTSSGIFATSSRVISP
jgi:FMN-dependent NADH-azoreductase